MSSNSDISSLSSESQPVLAGIRDWFEAATGQHVLATEKAMLDQLLPGMFGYHLAQLSIQDSPLFDASPVQQKIRVNLDTSCREESHPHTPGNLVAVPTHLPFSNDSIDVVLLHHLLDFVESPQEVLREVSRVTLPMGHVVIVGFNPLSMWGAWQAFARFKGGAPWNGRFIRPGRLMDWLNLLNFKIDRAQYAIYRPPVKRYLGRVGDFSKGVSRNLNLPVGSVYVIVAQKHIGNVRSIKPVWKQARAFGRLSVVRSVKHDALNSSPHQQGQD